MLRIGMSLKQPLKYGDTLRIAARREPRLLGGGFRGSALVCRETDRQNAGADALFGAATHAGGAYGGNAKGGRIPPVSLGSRGQGSPPTAKLGSGPEGAYSSV